MPEEILNLMKLDAVSHQTPSAVGKTDETSVDQSAVPPTDLASPFLPSANRSVEPTVKSTKVVRRISVPMLLMGIFMVFVGGAMFFVPERDNVSHSTSRRVRAVERAIGPQATTFLSGLILIGGGAWVIYASRMEMIEGEASSGAAHTCDMCDKTSSDNGEAFVTVAGGPDLVSNTFRWLSPAFQRKYGSKHRFPGAFQCKICDSCVRGSRSLFRAHILQAILLGTAVVVDPLALYAAILLLVGPNRDPRPGSEILLGVVFGTALFNVISIPLLQRYISRGTSRLLGSRLDPIIRQIVGIECWGWRRCVNLSRFVSSKTPIIEIAQKQ